MNSTRQQLMGERESLKQKDMAVIIAGKAAIDAIKNTLATSSVIPLEKINAQAVLHYAEELAIAQNRHKDLREKIQAITEELE